MASKAKESLDCWAYRRLKDEAFKRHMIAALTKAVMIKTLADESAVELGFDLSWKPRVEERCTVWLTNYEAKLKGETNVSR